MGSSMSSVARSACLGRAALAVSALLAFIGAVAAGCHSEQQNGQECLKNDDCESKRCIQYVCVDPASGKIADSGQPPVDAPSEAASDAPADAPGEVAADSAKADGGGD